MEPEEFADEAQMERAVQKVVTSLTVQGSKRLLLPLHLRSKADEIPFWTTPEGQKEINQAIEPIKLLDKLTDLVQNCLGYETVECLKQNYKDKLRNAFERSDAGTQCNNVIGKADGQNCWICGGLVQPGADNEGLQPECEHVFPIAQALVFTGLYEHSFFDSLSDAVSESYKVGLQMEYRWAHQICNQVKNDTHFITLSDGIFSINDTKIKNFLNKLINHESYGGGKNLCRYLGHGDLQAGIQVLYRRINDIKNTCQPIIDVITHLNITPKQHAICTVMYMKEYLATDPYCSSEEVIASIIPMASIGKLSLIDISGAYAILEFSKRLFEIPLSNQIFGKYKTILRIKIDEHNSSEIAAGRNIINAVGRARITERLFEIEFLHKSYIQKYLINTIPILRKKLLLYIYSLKPRNEEYAWSRFQVLSSQVIFAIVILETLKNFTTHFTTMTSRVFTPEELTVVLAPLNTDEFKAFISNLYIEKMTILLPVLADKPIEIGQNDATSISMSSEAEAILQSIQNQNIESVRNTNLPRWFQAGGGNKRALVKFMCKNSPRNTTKKMRKNRK